MAIDNKKPQNPKTPKPPKSGVTVYRQFKLNGRTTPVIYFKMLKKSAFSRQSDEDYEK